MKLVNGILWLATGITALIVLLLLFATTAHAHTDDDLDAWETNWQDRLLHAAITETFALDGYDGWAYLITTTVEDLIAERTDMEARHPCQLKGVCRVVSPSAAVSVPVRSHSMPLAPMAVRALVEKHFPPEWVEEALAVSWCESRWDPGAKNRRSTASGLFQFLRGTWDWVAGNTGTGSHATSAFDAESNTINAAWLVNYSQNRGDWRWRHWVCQP